MPSIKHPTDRPNFSIANFDWITIAFSYETMVGYQVPGSGWVVRQNDWGPTTGKHLNHLQSDHTKRLSKEDFMKRFDDDTSAWHRDHVLNELHLPPILFDNRKPYVGG